MYNVRLSLFFNCLILLAHMLVNISLAQISVCLNMSLGFQ